MHTTSRARKTFAGIAVAATVALGLGACSSGSGGQASSSEDAISFRTIAAVGSEVSNYPDAEAGARAAVKAINAAGGVKGRKIDLSFCNTRAEGNQAMACSRQAVQDGVAAIVGKVDIFASQSMPILEGAGVPDIGAVPISDIENQSPVSFPFHEGNYGAFASAPALFKAAGKKKMAVVQLDFATTAVQAKMVEKAAAAVGMDSAGEILVPASGVADYSSYAQQVKDRGADCALVLLGPAGEQAFYKSAESLGVKAQFASSVFSFGESEARDGGKAADGLWVLSPFPSPSDETDPMIKKYNEELTASGVAAGDLELRRTAGLNAWLAVYAAAAVAETITGDVTAKSMTAAMATMGETDVQGFAWDPSEAGSDELGKFPRLPKVAMRALTFDDDDRMVPVAGLDPIDDPLASLR